MAEKMAGLSEYKRLKRVRFGLKKKKLKRPHNALDFLSKQGFSPDTLETFYDAVEAEYKMLEDALESTGIKTEEKSAIYGHFRQKRMKERFEGKTNYILKSMNQMMKESPGEPIAFPAFMNDWSMRWYKEYAAVHKFKKNENSSEYEHHSPGYCKDSVRWTRVNLHLLKLCREQGIIFSVKEDNDTGSEALNDENDPKPSTSSEPKSEKD